MTKFPMIEYSLKTIFNVEAGFTEEEAIGMYLRNFSPGARREALKSELDLAFSDQSLRWKAALHNDIYEVYPADTEEGARAFARRILWDPLFDSA